MVMERDKHMDTKCHHIVESLDSSPIYSTLTT